AVVGAIALIVSFTALDWFTKGTAGQSHFGDVKKALDLVDNLGNLAAGPAKLYFGWLGWVLLIVTVALALAANLPSPAAASLRLLGVLAAVAGVVMTFLAIKLTKGAVDLGSGNRGTYAEYFKHA